VLEHAAIARSPATDAALEELHAYHAVHNLWELVPEAVVPALQRLRALVPRLVVVSNANGRLHVVMERLGLAPFFDARKETTLHVGDFYWIDVQGARAAGLRAVLLDSAGLYPEADCARVGSLGEIADLLEGAEA
jgi:FMN phosphatase YigB (HAD superfamily)